MIDDEIVQPDDIETPAPALEDNEDLEPEVPGEAPLNETPEQKDARIAELEERNGKLWARIQRGKGKPAAAAPATPATKPADTAPTGLTRDEAILFSKGFDEGEVEYANKIAMLEGISVSAATQNPLFTTWKSNKDADQKKLQAQLGTSKGARTTVKKSLDTPGLSDEDHKAMFEEMNG